MGLSYGLYLERDQDVQIYQGQSFSYIAVDELISMPLALRGTI